MTAFVSVLWMEELIAVPFVAYFGYLAWVLYQDVYKRGRW